MADVQKQDLMERLFNSLSADNQDKIEKMMRDMAAQNANGKQGSVSGWKFILGFCAIINGLAAFGGMTSGTQPELTAFTSILCILSVFLLIMGFRTNWWQK